MEDSVRIDGKEYRSVCRQGDLLPGRSRLVYFDEDRQIALFNVEGMLYAVNNICPHQHAPVLSDGFVEDCSVTCPLHGNTYDLRTGTAAEGGARLKTFEVRTVDDAILVEIPPEEQPAWMRGM